MKVTVAVASKVITYIMFLLLASFKTLGRQKRHALKEGRFNR